MSLIHAAVVSLGCLLVTVPQDPGAADEGIASTVARLLSEGKPGEALEAVDLVLEKPPAGADLAVLHTLRGKALESSDRLWDAEAAYARALEIDTSSIPAARARGLVFLELTRRSTRKSMVRGAEVRALAADGTLALSAALALSPSDRACLEAMGQIRLLAEDFPGSVKWFRKLVELKGAEAGPHLLLAGALRLAGDREGAVKAERTALELEPDRSPSGDLVGDLGELGRLEEARKTALDGLLARPENNDLYRSLWRLDVPAGRHTALEASLVTILEKHADQPTALYYLGFARLQAGRTDEALQAFERRQEVAPGNAEVLLQTGRIHSGKERMEAAATAYSGTLDAAAADSPTWTAALQGLSAVGRRYGRDKRYEDAETVFRRLCDVEEDAPEHWINLALSLRRLRRYEESEACYNKAVERAPFDGWPRNDLGLLYMAWGKKDRATAVFLEAREADPRLTDPLENLGAMARMDGDRSAAVRWFREAHERSIRFGDEKGRRKFRRLMDVCSRETAALPNTGDKGR
ncbi:MAG: tetratricopeptide repeat protein [Planctomycetota bacterium]|jgi:tetratricopeptide (TPR) repeat protein